MTRLIVLTIIFCGGFVQFAHSQSSDSDEPYVAGLNFEYYTGNWDKLPNFNQLTPKATGVVSNFDISIRQSDDQFGFRFEGFIHTSRAGEYKFYLTSDDGSKLFVENKEVVNNDGLHSRQERSGTIQLNEGYHPIKVVYFENQGNQVLEIRYQGPRVSKRIIPDEVLFREHRAGQPLPWNHTDIGKVGQAGSASYSNGVFTITASGADIWNEKDEFHFVYWPLSGDGEAIAKILSITKSDNWAKAGVMIRETLKADSKHAFMCVTPVEGVAFQRRIKTGNSSTHTGATGSAPIWLKLNRTGNQFKAFKSDDSLHWELVGTETITMTQNSFIGLALTSHNDNVLCTARGTFNLSGAFGEIALQATPTSLPADGKSITRVTSDPLIDFYGRLVKSGVLVTVKTDQGQILSPDADNSHAGIQVKTDDSGRFSFELKSNYEPGIATIEAISVYGNAAGKTTISFVGDNIKLIATRSEKDKITRGQENIEVVLVAENDGVATSIIKEATLIMKTASATNTNNSYQITRTDTFTQIPPNRTREFTFLVKAKASVTPGVTVIDGRIVTNNNDYSGVNQKHQWEVQTPPALNILSVQALAEEVYQKQTGLVVKLEVANEGMAAVNQINASLTFWHNQNNVSHEYNVKLSEDNPQTINGQSKETLNLLVDVKYNATIGDIDINGQLTAHDVNSGLPYQAQDNNKKDKWTVKRAEGIIFKAIHVSQKYATRGKTEPWFFNALIKNQTGTDLVLDSTRVSFQIESTDVTEEYQIHSPQKFSGSQSKSIKNEGEDSLRFNVDAVGFTTGFLEITCHVYLHEPNQNFVVHGASPPGLGYLFITNQPEIQVVSTVIDSCFNLKENGDGFVNVGQNYAVKVILRNISDEDIADIVITLTSNGQSQFISGANQTLALLQKDRTKVVHFRLLARASTLPKNEQFTSTVTQGTGVKSGEAAIVTLPADFKANVTIQNPATLTLSAESPGRVNINQNFQITAIVTNPPNCAGCDSSGLLALVLPTGYQVVAGKINHGFKVNESVVWTVKAPATPQARDSVYIQINKKPRDLNSLKYAKITNQADTVLIETREAIFKIAAVEITQPAGAVDDTLSTGQRFELSASVNALLVVGLKAGLTPPEGYAKIDSSVQAGNPKIFQWQLTAPSVPQLKPRKFYICAFGKLKDDTTMIFSETDSSLALVVEEKANLKIQAKIISPLKAVQGRISPGMEFKIKGEIINLGHAQTGEGGRLMLDLNTEYFHVQEELVLPVKNDSVIWTIQTANNLPRQNWLIKVKVTEIPFDCNTNTTAYMLESNKAAEIVITSASTGVGRLELGVNQIPRVTPVAIVPGETSILMGLLFTNRVTETDYPILINGLKLEILDKTNQPIDPTGVLSNLRVMKQNKVLGEAISITENPISIPFIVPDTIPAFCNDSLFIEADLLDPVAQPFHVYLKDSTYVEAQSHVEVYVVSENGKSSGILNLHSPTPEITPRDFKKSFANYPNPFGNYARPQTRFIYYLSCNSWVELKIYTLLGELVWECYYSARQRQGQQGLHVGEDITWDATNLAQQPVLNGVYLAVLKTGDGKSAITKVAVIK